MAVQERNSEMVNLLKADFVAKNESIYSFTAYQNFMRGLPGLIGLWTMGGINPTNVLYSGQKTSFDVANDILGLGTVDPTGGGTITPALTVAQADGATAIAIVDKATNVGRMAINGVAGGAFQMYDRGNGVGWALGIVQKAGDFYLGGKIGGPWIALPYTNSGGNTWTDYDAANWAVGAYKICGDMVFIKGLVKQTAGTGIIIATLPGGYRPPRNVLYSAICNGGHCRVDVNTAGEISLQSGTSGWVSLNLPPFSVA